MDGGNQAARLMNALCAGEYHHGGLSSNEALSRAACSRQHGVLIFCARYNIFVSRRAKTAHAACVSYRRAASRKQHRQLRGAVGVGVGDRRDSAVQAHITYASAALCIDPLPRVCDRIVSWAAASTSDDVAAISGDKSDMTIRQWRKKRERRTSALIQDFINKHQTKRRQISVKKNGEYFLFLIFPRKRHRAETDSCLAAT